MYTQLLLNAAAVRNWTGVDFYFKNFPGSFNVNGRHAKSPHGWTLLDYALTDDRASNLVISIQSLGGKCSIELDTQLALNAAKNGAWDAVYKYFDKCTIDINGRNASCVENYTFLDYALEQPIAQFFINDIQRRGGKTAKQLDTQLALNAAENGNWDAVYQYIDKININGRHSKHAQGWTLLDYATSQQSECQADIECRGGRKAIDYNTFYVLDSAAKNKWEVVKKCLQNLIIDINGRHQDSPQGLTLLDYAQQAKEISFISGIKQQGGKTAQELDLLAFSTPVPYYFTLSEPPMPLLLNFQNQKPVPRIIPDNFIPSENALSLRPGKN